MEREETLVTVPAELVVKCGGLAFDIGGSVMKLVYRTKDDYEKAKAETVPSTPSTMRLVSFSRQELDQAIEFIKEKAYITKTPGQDTTVYTTGVGGSQFKQKIDEEISVKTEVLGEGTCFCCGMIYLLKNLALQEIVHPFDEPEMTQLVTRITSACDGIIQMIKSGAETMVVPGFTPEDVTTEKLLGGILEDFKPTLDLTKSQENIFPIGLVFCGSAFGIMKLNTDGTYSTMDMQMRGGRSCLGMANVFLGCKNYEEFLALAEKGNSENVDYCDSDMMGEMMAGSEGETEGQGTTDSSKGQDVYNAWSVEDTAYNGAMYSLGKMVGKSFADFKREDLAHALLRYVCSDLAQMVDQTLRQDINDDVRHVFFLGSFPSNKLTRDLLTEELILRSCMSATFTAKRRPYNFYFVKHGAHIGCLGSLINTTEKFAPAAE